MLEVDALTKRYGDHYAIRDLTFHADRGDILGFLGQNGAGKSTTMNIITGYISATRGNVRVNGQSITRSPRACRRLIGYLPEIPPLYVDMTVREYLRFVCEIKEVSPRRIRSHVDELCELLNLRDHAGRLIGNLSKGYRQRVGMAQALAGDPEIVILDEPTVGLDPRQTIEIRDLVKWLGEKHTVILSSHILSEVAEVCNRAVIIHRGLIIAQDTMNHLMLGDAGEQRETLIRLSGPETVARPVLLGVNGVLSVKTLPSAENEACDFLVKASADVDVRRAMSPALAQAGIAVLMMRPAGNSLEEIFLKLTGDAEVSEK